MLLRAGFHIGWFSSPLVLLPHGRFGLVVAVVVELVVRVPVQVGNLSSRVMVAAIRVGLVVQGVLSCWDVQFEKGVVRGLVVVLPNC